MEKYHVSINFESRLLNNKHKSYCIKPLKYYIEKYLNTSYRNITWIL